MEYTVHHPDGSTTTHEEDCPYIREETHEMLVLTNDRERLFPKVARRLIPDGFHVSIVAYNNGVVAYENPAPPELEDAVEARFVVRDETGANCVIYTRVKDPGALT